MEMQMTNPFDKTNMLTSHILQQQQEQNRLNRQHITPVVTIKRRRHPVEQPITNTIVPVVGLELACDVAMLRPMGSTNTPSTKIRFIDGVWQQVAGNTTGLFVFFDNTPEPGHTKFRITSLIRSGAACHAVLL